MSIKIYLYAMIRRRDDCSMFLTAVPRSRGRGSVKIVFFLFKDDHFPKREKTPIITAEKNECFSWKRRKNIWLFPYKVLLISLCLLSLNISLCFLIN